MFLSLPRSNYKPTEKSGPSVCLLKALLLVNNGLIEYVHFVAPHEEWHFSQMPRFGTKKQAKNDKKEINRARNGTIKVKKHTF